MSIRQRVSVGKQWKRLDRFLLAGVLLVVFWPVLTFVYVATDNETDYAVASDVIIVLGCPSYEGNIVSTTFSSCLLARAHHAAGLYHRGLAGQPWAIQ